MVIMDIKPKKKTSYSLFLLALLVLVCSVFVRNDEWLIYAAESVKTTEPSGTTVYAEGIDWPIEPEISGKSSILIEVESGGVIYSSEPDKELYPASITKIMTGLLAVENLNLTDNITFTQEMLESIPYDAAILGVSAGETMTVEDCLYALMLRSCNDIAIALAYEISGDEVEFGKLMTQRAIEIGAVNTNFVNSTGLHDDNHYTTARDMALIAVEAIKNPTFAKIWGTQSFSLDSYDDDYVIWHRHDMLIKGRGNYYAPAVGGKTGYTDEAGRTLVTCAESNGMKLVSVILFSTNEEVFNDTKTLMNYGFDNFKKVTANANDSRFMGSVNQGFSIVNHLLNNESSIFGLGNETVVIPINESLSDIGYMIKMEESNQEGIIASIKYIHGENVLGETKLLSIGKSNNALASIVKPENVETKSETQLKEAFVIEIKYIIIGIAIVLIVALYIVYLKATKGKRKRKKERKVKFSNKISKWRA